MIPRLDATTGYLPFTGEEPIPTTLREVEERFAIGPWRCRLWDAFGWWRDELNRAGFPGVLRLGGSFITAKEDPHDVDVLVVVDPEDVSVASRMIRPNGHLWTLQGVGLYNLRTQSFDWFANRVQPMLGLVDAFQATRGTVKDRAFARDWTSEHDDGGNPTGVRKGWLEVADR